MAFWNRLRNLKPPGPDGSRKRHARHQWLTRNFSLKVFSLLLAVLMWGFVASQKRGESTEIKFSSPLVLKNIPRNLEVASTELQPVSVLVRTRRARANSVNPNQFQVGIDLSNQFAGTFEYTLTDKNISYNNVSPPEGMTVLQISPPVIPLVLEETVQKVVPIEAKLTGDLAPGYTLESVRMIPDRVKLQGARAAMETLATVFTRPLDVQDLRNNVDMLANLDLPAAVRLAQGQDGFFRARITLSGSTTRVVLRNVPLVVENATDPYRISTKQVNVHLEGPREVMQALDRKNVQAVMDLAKYPPGDYRSLMPKVVVPEMVRVLQVWPIVDLYVYKQKPD
jgi:YbbR domain-containing protein